MNIKAIKVLGETFEAIGYATLEALTQPKVQPTFKEEPKAERKPLEVTLGYTLEDLTAMSTRELKKEVYAIYQENDSIFYTDEARAIGKKAEKLYYQTVYSESRYRAQLIKFLLENGDI